MWAIQDIGIPALFRNNVLNCKLVLHFKILGFLNLVLDRIQSLYATSLLYLGACSRHPEISIIVSILTTQKKKCDKNMNSSFISQPSPHRNIIFVATDLTSGKRESLYQKLSDSPHKNRACHAWRRHVVQSELDKSQTYIVASVATITNLNLQHIS